MKKKILITGANGFLGQSFIEGLDKNLYDIYALGRQESFLGNDKDIKKYYQEDIKNEFLLPEDFYVVIHLAALNQTNINSDFEYEVFKSINVTGTKNVLKSCKFEKFIFLSTANLYEKKSGDTKETDEIKPKSFYEKSKYEAEEICKEYISEEKLVILRPVNITGIKQRNKAIIPFFFSRAVKDESINIFVPKNKRVQLMTSDDVIKAVEKIISNENVHGVFNLANNDSEEVRKVAEKIVSFCNSKSEVICTNDEIEECINISSSKAEKVLGWKAEDTIDKIISNYGKKFLKTND